MREGRSLWVVDRAIVDIVDSPVAGAGRQSKSWLDVGTTDVDRGTIPLLVGHSRTHVELLTWMDPMKRAREIPRSLINSTTRDASRGADDGRVDRRDPEPTSHLGRVEGALPPDGIVVSIAVRREWSAQVHVEELERFCSPLSRPATERLLMLAQRARLAGGHSRVADRFRVDHCSDCLICCMA